MNVSLRFFLNTSLIILFLGSVANACKKAPKEQKEVVDAFAAADRIIKDIVVPQFPDRDFNIVDFGAVADGGTDNTQAFKLAIESCNKEGGGKVIVPEGSFLTGPIHLKREREFLMDRQVKQIGGLGAERKNMGILMGNRSKKMITTCLGCVK